MAHKYTEYKRPEIGVVPETFVEEQRVVDLLEAMTRRAKSDGDFEFVSQHLPELTRRIKWLNENRETWKIRTTPLLNLGEYGTIDMGVM